MDMYGRFIHDTAGYEISTMNLPTSWEYIYENKDILLKVDQFGPVYAQASPPGDIMLFQREKHQKSSPWCIHLHIDDKEPITNFFRPNKLPVGSEPEQVKIVYRPECATYTFTYQGMVIKTELFIPNKGTTIVYKLSVKNQTAEKTNIRLNPQLIPYLNDAVMAPWDKYEWYLDTNCRKSRKVYFETRLLSANACAEGRSAYLALDIENLCAHEISLEKYVGQSDVSFPEQIHTNQKRLYAYPPVYACSYEWQLEPEEEKELTQVFALAATGEEDAYFEQTFYEKAKEERKRVFEKMFAKNRIRTGDEEFDYYANYWVPIQLEWITSLDRGWPTGMRGTRDSAQDFIALLYVNPDACKNIILMMLECQRGDGWFPRQYSAQGRGGKHDLREYVDGGAFFIEFMWKYLAHTGDYDILKEQIPWLDKDETNSVLEHLICAAEYYIRQENLGEHGLCKIREGDWLDSVNRAGVEGRGESVTVSEQMVLGLQYLADILRRVQPERTVTRYLECSEQLKKNINKYAWNEHGFYNGAFTDNGEWIFSEQDPDGLERIYGVVNYYAVISGVAEPEKYESILKNADRLKCDKGYRLFYPYMGEIPIDKVGRVASGDTPPFLVENGNVYNHGSQGFFARALSVMGEGDRLLDVLKWLLPYDTQRHCTEKVFTPPYAIVNCYQQLPGFDHRGLMCFLTGSVAMAMRGVYEWFAGIKPCLDGLELEPCLPKDMKEIEVTFEYLRKNFTMKIEGTERILLNGKPVTQKRKSMFLDREVWFVALEQLEEEYCYEGGDDTGVKGV